MNITRKQLNSFINDRYIKRGEQIVKEGTVLLEKIHPEHIEAYAIGTGVYRVRLSKSASSSKISGICSCPAFADFGPCKHIAAVGLARIQVDYKPDSWCSEQIEELKDTLQVLHKLSKEKLIDIIMDCIARDQELLYLIPESEDVDDSNE